MTAFEQTICDQKRGRFNRLAQAVAVQPGMVGIGLAEDTGVIIYPGNRIEVIGSGIVTIVNGKHISSPTFPTSMLGCQYRWKTLWSTFYPAVTSITWEQKGRPTTGPPTCSSTRAQLLL